MNLKSYLNKISINQGIINNIFTNNFLKVRNLLINGLMN